MKIIKRHKLQRMFVKSNITALSQLRLHRTDISKLLQQGQSYVVNLVRGKGIDPYAAKMIKFGVIPERQYQWLDHSSTEMNQFIGALKIVPSLLEGSGQMISVIKDKDVSCEVVWEALVRTLAMRGNGGNTLSRFMLDVNRASTIELIITGSNNRVVIPKAGTVIFDKSSLKGEMKDHFKQLNASKTANVVIREAKHILREAGKTPQQTEDYLTHNSDHVKAVVSSYFQLETLNYHPDLAKSIMREFEPAKRKCFLKLFDKDVLPERILRNISFLKDLFMKVPPRIILPTIIYHDIGKEGPGDMAHSKVGAQLFSRVDLNKKFGIDTTSADGIIDKTIIMNSINHHIVPGGLALGEYSYGYLFQLFDEHFFVNLLNTGKANLFIDNLTLLTACDIAGYAKSHIPLNFKIESLIQMNLLLKQTFATIASKRAVILTCGVRWTKDMFADIDTIDDYSFHMLKKELDQISNRITESRLARLLASDDALMDKNTNKGLDTYIKILYRGIADAGLTKREKGLLLKLFSSVTDYSYSSRINSYLLWGKNIKESGGVRFGRDKMNAKALKFFVQVAKAANISNETQVKMMFVRPDGSLIANYNSNWGSIELLLEKINKGDIEEFLKVTTEIIGTEKTIKIHLPQTVDASK